MFAKLTGTIDTLYNDSLILDVNGVGYHVYSSAKTLSAIGDKGNKVSLLIETHVREDHIHLYGFASASEQAWFRLLTSVQGVGAKSGLAILSSCPPDRLLMAIAAQDVAVLRQADGVGPKLAARIATELKDKVQSMSQPLAAPLKPKTGKSAGPEEPVQDTNLDSDAVSVLVNLGYGRTEAFSAVMQVRQKSNDNPAPKLDELIKLALKELAS